MEEEEPLLKYFQSTIEFSGQVRCVNYFIRVKKSSLPVDRLALRASSDNEGVVVTDRGMHPQADRKIVSCNRTKEFL